MDSPAFLDRRTCCGIVLLCSFSKGEPGRANCRVAAALSGSGSTAGSRLILQRDGWVSLAGSSLILLPSICIHFVLGLKPLARDANTNTSMRLPLSFPFHVGLRITPENPKAHNEPSNYQQPRAQAATTAENKSLGVGRLPALTFPQALGAPFSAQNTDLSRGHPPTSVLGRPISVLPKDGEPWKFLSWFIWVKPVVQVMHSAGKTIMKGKRGRTYLVCLSSVRHFIAKLLREKVDLFFSLPRMVLLEKSPRDIQEWRLRSRGRERHLKTPPFHTLEAEHSFYQTPF